jgi:hypothetical protein
MSVGDDLTKGASHEKRSEPREAARDPARLLLDRDMIMEATIVDRSVKGMRLRLPIGATVAANLTLTALDLKRATILRVKVIWKAYPDVGVQIQASFNVRTGAGPEADAMRRLWSRATSLTG